MLHRVVTYFQALCLDCYVLCLVKVRCHRVHEQVQVLQCCIRICNLRIDHAFRRNHCQTAGLCRIRRAVFGRTAVGRIVGCDLLGCDCSQCIGSFFLLILCHGIRIIGCLHKCRCCDRISCRICCNQTVCIDHQYHL